MSLFYISLREDREDFSVLVCVTPSNKKEERKKKTNLTTHSSFLFCRHNLLAESQGIYSYQSAVISLEHPLCSPPSSQR